LLLLREPEASGKGADAKIIIGVLPLINYLPTYHSALQLWVSLGLIYNQSPQAMLAVIGMEPHMMTRG
jgi:hypothetical protein